MKHQKFSRFGDIKVYEDYLEIASQDIKRKYIMGKKNIKIKFLALSIILFLGIATFLLSNSIANVKAQDELDKSINLEKAKVATVFILTRQVALIIWPTVQQIGISPVLEVDAVGSGTGFLVNPDGYIVTNGHVVAEYKSDIEKYRGLLYSYISKIVEVLQLHGEQITQDFVSQLESAVISSFATGDLQIKEYRVEVFVGLGKVINPLGNLPAFFPARIVDAKPAEVEDLAVIKVEKSNLPSLLVAERDYLKTGDRIWVLGYPGVVIRHGYLEKGPTLYSPSVTSGTVSGYRTKETGPKVFQADAPVTHGNSGGPAVDVNGKVVGVATFISVSPQYGQQIQGFNFFMSASLVNEILARNRIDNSQGPIMQLFDEALRLYFNKHYSAALEKFGRIKNLYPIFPYIDEYISDSQAAIERGEDVPLINWTLIGIIAGVIAAAGLGTFYFFFIRTGKVLKKKPYKPVQYPPQYQVQQPVSIQQPQTLPQQQVQPTQQQAMQPQQPLPAQPVTQQSVQQPIQPQQPQETKFCIYCGERIPLVAQVCPKCGNRQI